MKNIIKGVYLNNGIMRQSHHISKRNTVFLNRVFWYKDYNKYLEQDEEMYYSIIFNSAIHPMKVKRNGS